ncbi:MAG: 4Fe-4S dicluster domain-containing protein [Syntrophomonadaceae bacterium]|nr:4Fe-4S dicluster domain-containing protein [Syntrophomonadaceae bacterium]
MAQQYINLYDVTKCMACRGCQVACKQWNQLGVNIVPFSGGYGTKNDTDAKTFTVIKFWEDEEGGKVRWRFRKHQCFHCNDPACMKVCPRGAIHKTEYGAVAKDYDKCVGCKYCVAACPFGIPKYDPEIDKVTKCEMCSDRVDVFASMPDSDDPQKQREKYNFVPACAKTCPTGSIKYGPREVLLKEAEARVAFLKANGYPNANIYNPAGVGGTNKVYILADTPDKYDLPVNPTTPAYINVWQPWIKPYGGILIGLAALGAVGSFFSTRLINAFGDKIGLGGHDEGGKKHDA